ncbi:hypothetical protein [Luteimonas terricola]|uniref:Cytochrome c domain-containing protein n=1 Tax=Luteimonas terricola TaxID=645597 RepID=A0ABQ2EJE1_9GAMM|nr:hypothetical protein [Luteimonas terricola]GGK13956.1 hypothetical protein GCM10011394_24080 [Luteimonas terricola]
MTTRNPAGWLRSVNRLGAIDLQSAFFQSLGRNGRSCSSCHEMGAAWSITPREIQARFDATDGTDPLFRPNDGSNSPRADVSTTQARRRAYSMLLRRGVIRVGIGIPEDAEFVLAAVDDPYGYASAKELSLFRRPLPSTNLAFLTGVMWDGRETTTAFLPPMHAGQSNAVLTESLIRQVTSATVGHAEGLDPTPEQIADIVAFETGLTTAQVRDDVAGYLNADDALGGPRILANQRFHIGINDTLGADPTGAAFDPRAMDLFAGWSRQPERGRVQAQRASIARGERLFNEMPIDIGGVAGLNDALGVTSIRGTCSTCHNAPNVGNHTVTLPLDLGLTDASRRTPDMPLYTLVRKSNGDRVQTTDPGLALITGKWADIGRFKGPILRGLAARPPYFHNGFAPSLEKVVEFYDTRFEIDMSEREKRDMAAFLRAL